MGSAQVNAVEVLAYVGVSGGRERVSGPFTINGYDAIERMTLTMA